MPSLEIFFMIASAIFSALLLALSAWSIIRSHDMIGSSINVAVSIMVVFCSLFEYSSIKRNLVCIKNPALDILKWGVLSAVLAYLLWDSYCSLRRKETA